MRKNIIKIIGIFTILILQLVSISNAAVGAQAKKDVTEVEQGKTFDVYITLDVVSEAYDIKFNVNDSSLISKSEVVPTIEGNKLSGNNRIYLVQIDSAENRIKHQVGTKIACMRYTVAENAKVGSEIEVSVTGDIVGENNSQNTINDTIRVKVIEAKKDNQKGKDPTTADKDLANGGKGTFIIGISVSVVICVILGIMYKKNKF